MNITDDLEIIRDVKPNVERRFRCVAQVSDNSFAKIKRVVSFVTQCIRLMLRADLRKTERSQDEDRLEYGLEWFVLTMLSIGLARKPTAIGGAVLTVV